MEELSVTKSLRSVLRFECDHCGHVGQARVVTDGTGISRAENVAEANREATEMGEANARSALAIAQCPRCGRRKSSAVYAVVAWTLLPALFFLGIGVVLWPLGALMRLFSCIWFAAALGTLVVGWRSLGRGRREVTFLDR